jgi:hypothetical protein
VNYLPLYGFCNEFLIGSKYDGDVKGSKMTTGNKDLNYEKALFGAVFLS